MLLFTEKGTVKVKVCYQSHTHNVQWNLFSAFNPSLTSIWSKSHVAGPSGLPGRISIDRSSIWFIWRAGVPHCGGRRMPSQCGTPFQVSRVAHPPSCPGSATVPSAGWLSSRRLTECKNGDRCTSALGQSGGQWEGSSATVTWGQLKVYNVRLDM